MKIVIEINNEKIPVTIPKNAVQVFPEIHIEGSTKVEIEGVMHSVWASVPCDKNGIADSDAQALVQVYDIPTGALIHWQYAAVIEE